MIKFTCVTSILIPFCSSLLWGAGGGGGGLNGRGLRGVWEGLGPGVDDHAGLK